MSSLKTLITSVVGLLHTHVMLLQIDLQEEKEQLIRLVLLLIGVVLVGGILLIMLTAVVGIVCWQYSPLYTVMGLVNFYGLCTLFFVCRIRALLRQSRPFSITAAELEKNREVFFDA